MHTLTTVQQRLSWSQNLLVDHVVDVTDPNSYSELQQAVRAQSIRFEADCAIGLQTLTACGLYATDQAGFQLLKRAQPVDAIADENALLLLNVAEIREAEDGRRKDHLFVATSHSGRLIVGYAANNSPILHPVLPFIDELYVFDTPPEWDRHQTFRSRNVLPRVAMGVIAKNEEVWQHLRRVPLTKARDTLGVIESELSRAGWFDGFGNIGDFENRYNLKSAYTEADVRALGLEYGDEVAVQVDDHEPVTAVFARSLAASGRLGELILCQGSSGYTNREGEEIRFLDLMKYGGSAWAQLGKPGSNARIGFESKTPSHTSDNGKVAVSS